MATTAEAHGHCSIKRCSPCKNDDRNMVPQKQNRKNLILNLYDRHIIMESRVSLCQATLRTETDERNRIQKEEKHFRNQWTLPLCNQPIQLASQSAPTEMLMGQTTVKPFAISDFDSPTFFQRRDKDEDGSAVQGKERSCCICRSALKFADGR